MNEVEHCEKRKDSQLLKDIVLALPDDKELTLQDRINITHFFISLSPFQKKHQSTLLLIHPLVSNELVITAHLALKSETLHLSTQTERTCTCN